MGHLHADKQFVHSKRLLFTVYGAPAKITLPFLVCYLYGRAVRYLAVPIPFAFAAHGAKSRKRKYSVECKRSANFISHCFPMQHPPRSCTENMLIFKLPALTKLLFALLFLKNLMPFTPFQMLARPFCNFSLSAFGLAVVAMAVSRWSHKKKILSIYVGSLNNFFNFSSCSGEYSPFVFR